ncbi:MAG: hypothetical protein HKP21_12920 [Xanthomonadales bacterium]|nr:FixH family protein [Gammaproteobacteria bacterium]MBT8074599.1 FixH family protein [Gammaproteobacteria bacterium]NNK05451.1 hypothetical protein [Xanthomonadales bacterium]NNK97491.1 hypothetical protein [Xanthomonadales bacterium]
MTNKLQDATTPQGDTQPWYKQFWPWFIIALPASVVVASFFTLYLAVSNPDQLVVDEDEYRQLKSELKAQSPEPESKESEDGDP